MNIWHILGNREHQNRRNTFRELRNTWIDFVGNKGTWKPSPPPPPPPPSFREALAQQNNQTCYKLPRLLFCLFWILKQNLAWMLTLIQVSRNSNRLQKGIPREDLRSSVHHISIKENKTGNWGAGNTKIEAILLGNMDPPPPPPPTSGRAWPNRTMQHFTKASVTILIQSLAWMSTLIQVSRNSNRLQVHICS